jgi:FtsH-binding integral membrane protein
MTHLEDRITRALTQAPTRPSPDLFDRVVDSIEADRRRRRHGIVSACAAAVLVTAVTAAVLLLTPRTNGALAMPWWILEVAVTLVLVAMAVWLGPFIKRFGRAYAADVFHDNPLTGKSYIVLTDIVYYLIFTAYILFGVHFAPQSDWNNDVSGLVTAEQLAFSAARIGGILLIIGILHGVNIVLMPVLGRLFSLNRRVPAAREVDRQGVDW